MFPVICTIGPFTVYSYGLMLVAAFSAGSLLACQQAKRSGINPDLIFNLLFTAFIFGIIGARIFYVLSNLSYYLDDPREIIMLQHGGLSWFGGLIMAIVASIAYLKTKKMRVLKVLDLIAPFVALAHAIGRIGCLLNGCCFGKPAARFGVYFEAHHAVLIPTQAYSCLLLLLIFVVLRLLQDRPHKEGQIFFIYLLLYSLQRFFIEFWRADNPSVLFHLTIFQVIGAVIFCIALLSLIIRRKWS